MATLIKGSPYVSSTHPQTGETDQVLERLRISPHAGTHIVQAFIKDLERKYDNRNAVVYETIESFKQLPPLEADTEDN
jgi:hypothetical protein